MNHRHKSIERFFSSSLLLIALATGFSGQQPAPDNSTALPAKCRTVAIIGAVRTPGRFELQRSVRLNELIASAGGVAESAGKVVQLTHMRSAEGCPNSDVDRTQSPDKILDLFPLVEVLKGEEKSNPYLQAGDIVVVPEMDLVYVIGSVVNPQAIYLKERLTLSQAIARVGGVVRDSRTDKVKIYRQTPGSSNRTQIIVDLKAISKHRAEDPVLEPYDIIEVPKHGGDGHKVPGPVLVVDLFGQLPLRIIK
jgi:polysaccharide export outer membrane protein